VELVEQFAGAVTQLLRLGTFLLAATAARRVLQFPEASEVMAAAQAAVVDRSRLLMLPWLVRLAGKVLPS
jgi:hypothetical protein